MFQISKSCDQKWSPHAYMQYSSSVENFVIYSPLTYYQLNESTESSRTVILVLKSILCLEVTEWLCFTSGHPIDSCPFHSVTIGLPIPEMQFDFENSSSMVTVKGTIVSAASSWLFCVVFHIRAYCRHPSLSFHDNRASHFPRCN